jgi:hypothetical protein
MFRRQSKPRTPPAAPAGDGAALYHGLRAQVLDLDPASVELTPGPEHPQVWGALMDMGFPSGTATLVALADGTTSLYTSTGGGIIGGGSHQAVTAATRVFLACVADHLGALAPETGTGLPARGRVIIRALTYQGQRAAEAAEDDLGYHRHALSPVFHAAHDVITQLRLLDEARTGTARDPQQPPNGNPPAGEIRA